MAWYWILAIIVGYLLVGGIISGVVEYAEGIEEEAMILIVLAWPILAAIGVVVGIFYIFGQLGSLIVNGIISAGEWICYNVEELILKMKVKRLDKRMSHIDKKISSTFETIEKDDIDYDEDPVSDKRRR